MCLKAWPLSAAPHPASGWQLPGFGISATLRGAQCVSFACLMCASPGSDAEASHPWTEARLSFAVSRLRSPARAPWRARGTALDARLLHSWVFCRNPLQPVACLFGLSMESWCRRVYVLGEPPAVVSPLGLGFPGLQKPRPACRPTEALQWRERRVASPAGPAWGEGSQGDVQVGDLGRR